MSVLYVLVIMSTFWFYGMSEESGFCSTRSDGYYSDPESCFHYIHCVGNQGNSMPCAEGTMWDDTIKTCAHSSGCTRNPLIQNIRVKEYSLDLGMRIEDMTLQDFVVRSVVDCARICMRSDNCLSFNYLTTTNGCQLFNTTIDTTNLIADTSFLYGHE